MITTMLTSLPPAAVAPLLWSVMLLLGVRAAMRSRDGRIVEPRDHAARASGDELRSAA